MDQRQIDLRKLHHTMDDDIERIENFIAVFIKSTPSITEQVEKSLLDGKWQNAADLIHGLKPRYGYLDLTEVMDQLTEWETSLRLGTGNDYSQRLNLLKKYNAEIIFSLKETRFYKHVKADGGSLLQGKCVLVAEDDEINAMVFELFIKEQGATVIVARDGNEALQFALDNYPDMIFMDVHMPFFSGLDAIKELRKKGISCPIVSLSASTRLNEKQNSLDAGADDFLVKPANRDTINKALLKYLISK
ncbi:response regulator [Chryseolinea sp. H1M3-3]|uniref:response regulator n=1 Tax=Chryseolinea sp. H1M3-3 TaxID=3034144 RepID=UPI0023ED1542|nr:response regulator [Chryseolinea sp. H1M3-3]